VFGERDDLTGKSNTYSMRSFHAVHAQGSKTSCASAYQLAELEDWAKRSAEYATGRGKNDKGRAEAAMRIHDEWAGRFKRMAATLCFTSPPRKPQSQ
jgi:hypothetical protein